MIDIQKYEGIEPVVIPHRAVSLIIKHGGPSAITIDGTDERKYVSYPMGAGTMTTRILEGRFPDYVGAIPKDASITIMFDPNEFFEITKGVIPIGGAKGQIDISIENEMAIQTSGDCGEYHWQIPAALKRESGSGALDLTFTLKFFMDAIRCYANPGPVFIETTTAYGAVLINKNALVMPIRK